ncbi:glutathione synthase [Novosphingobium mangrovi (ex Huang et al. 2023)]|uniref:Glutathione synthetase n=1 Tax=Novosphingobium mangrovi (ex Huang et al. 2023) TaxID=2976432 RepID=A0ABT2I458_9SPHN|nr:glutathione synthase [Novosphingobium mangrovi (ex Huang et al. 2023)]MCT2399594.1 glutathione synthase [Novosphingobium mangrovi (ex Huang et al. 2023)]
MTLRIAVQMDPLENINVAGDSSFALMLSAQARGHTLFHYDVRTLAYDTSEGAGGKLTCWGAPVTVERKEGAHFTRGEYRLIDLVADIDVVLMRQDPPFDLGYITATHLLERLEGQTLVVNDPASVRNAPEKVFVLDYARFMPPTFIARRIEDVRLFQQRMVDKGLPGDLVVKPLHGNGGKAVFRVPADGSNLGALVEMFQNAWVEPFMVQPFLPDVSEGDKRIVLVDGEFAGAINRKPGEGEFRSNLAVGGSAEACGLTPAEEEICAALGPELKARGLVFVGIDVIGGKWLTEINVTSPTGIVAIDKFNGTDTSARIWDAIEARHAAM